MPQLEPLNLRITGNADGLSAALGKSSRDVDQFSKGLGGRLGGLDFKSLAAPIGAAVVGSMAALGAAAGTAAVAVGKVYAELDKIADTQDVANKLAISFTELSGLRFSLGELSGLDTGTVDNALQKMLLGLAEAEKGSGKAKEALDRLGLDAGQLLSAGPVEALKQIADATNGLQDPTDQLVVAYELFGKQGAQLVGALRGGSEALEESYNFAAKWLGLSEEQSQLAAAASDSWARIGVILEGLVQLGAAELAPVFLAITESLLESSDGVTDLATGMRAMANVTAGVLGLLYDMGEALTANVRILASLTQGDVTGALEIAAKASTFDSAEKFLKAVEDKRKEFAESLGKKTDPVLDTEIEALEKSGAAMEKFTNAAAGISRAVERPKDQQGFLRGSSGAELAEVRRTLDPFNKPQIDPERQQQLLLAAQQKLVEDSEVEAKRQADADAQLLAVMEDTKQALDDIHDAIKNTDEPAPINL